MRKKPFQFESQDASSLVNLTPLLDVLFVVLILFIFITPFLEIDKVHLVTSEIEQKQQPNAIDSQPIIITVTSQQELKLNQKTITLAELKKVLPLIKEKQPYAIPKLYHDEQAPFGIYQRIKNLLEATGYEEMDVVLQTK